jgi:hypothetical protein
MNIELKNIKHAEFASEETACFSATVYIDGEKVGDVHNDGRGGCNMYSPWSIADRINAYAVTLPKIVDTEMKGEDGLAFQYQPDADTLVDELLTAWLVAKDLRRALKSKLLYVKQDGVVYETKPKKPHTVQTYLDAHTAGKIPWLAGATILNTLPEADALALYRKAGA